MNGRIYFTYERMEPFKYPEPRDIRAILQRKFCSVYKDSDVSNIPYSTEIVVKFIKSKDLNKADYTLLKYKIVNVDWEEIRNIKKVKFNLKNFRWLNLIEQNYEE